MHHFNHVLHFTINHLKQLQRKWRTLPLLLLIPLLFICLLGYIAIQVFSAEPASPIKIGLVDMDHSKETKMIINVLENAEQFKKTMHIQRLTEADAEKGIQQNQLHAYIRFPPAFSQKLYQGEAVTLHVIGNPKNQTKAKLVDTFIKSAANHINSAQADILAIGMYANKLGLKPAEKKALLQAQFKRFLLFTMAKDKAIDNKQLKNTATSAPIIYYSLAGWFVLNMLWLFVIYQFFHTAAPPLLAKRMALYGVTIYKRMLAKMIATCLVTSIFAALSFIVLCLWLQPVLFAADYLRIAILYVLLAVPFISSLEILELLIDTRKGCLMVQSMWTCMLLVVSGAVIPLIYFPQKIQQTADMFLTAPVFQNIQALILEGMTYMKTGKPVIMTILMTLILYGISAWKERVQ